MKTVKEILSANIKAKRKELDITQDKLAELADVSYQMIHEIEGCRTWVSDNTLQNISNALGVEIYELLYPINKNAADQKTKFSVRQIERFHKSIKSDIDRRLNELMGK